MSDLNAVVVGVGRLGTFHAQKYLELASSGVRLTALVDQDVERLKEKFPQIPGFASVDEMLEAEDRGYIPKTQLASVATTTTSHLDIGLKLLKAGKHILVEKPLCLTSADCKKIITVAETEDLKLAVGHVERHRATRLLQSLGTPKFIECHRLTPFSTRSTDIDVVRDLMIHDIDLMLSIVKSPLKFVHAAGFAVLTDKFDIANARFEFQDGCIANLTSSRVSITHTRKFRVFSGQSYLSLDLANGTYHRYHKDPSIKNLAEAISGDEGALEVKDALKSEVGDFVQSVREQRSPLVTGQDALRAQELAEKVLAEIHSRL